MAKQRAPEPDEIPGIGIVMCNVIQLLELMENRKEQP
jgi:hypothetical protein